MKTFILTASGAIVCLEASFKISNCFTVLSTPPNRQSMSLTIRASRHRSRALVKPQSPQLVLLLIYSSWNKRFLFICTSFLVALASFSIFRFSNLAFSLFYSRSFSFKSAILFSMPSILFIVADNCPSVSYNLSCTSPSHSSTSFSHSITLSNCGDWNFCADVAWMKVWVKDATRN